MQPRHREDLTQFYRQIPKGESTWLRNYSDGTITFTDADGNKTSCTLVPKGPTRCPMCRRFR